MPVVRRIECTVRNVRDHGEHVYSVDLEPSIPIPKFVAGQFLHLALDRYEPGGFWPDSRVFSIASSPEERSRLLITYAVKGTFTSRMEREIAAGVSVWVKLPYGEFVVDSERDAVLFAGGTGVTAFAAFLESLIPGEARRVALFYGARTMDLFIYRDLVEARAQAVPALAAHLICEVTDGRLDVDAAWPEIERLDKPVCYVSGPPSMLAAITAHLRDRGLPSSDVRVDAWE